MARAHGTLVALTAGDAGLAVRKREELWGALHTGVDLLFTNRWSGAEHTRQACTLLSVVSATPEHMPERMFSVRCVLMFKVLVRASHFKVEQVVLLSHQVGGLSPGGLRVQRAAGGSGARAPRRHGGRHRWRRRLLHLSPGQPAGVATLLLPA